MERRPLSAARSVRRFLWQWRESCVNLFRPQFNCGRTGNLHTTRHTAVSLPVRVVEQIIYLEPDEDILSIRDRIETAESKRVLLVVPPYSDALTRRVDVQVLQRRAAQAGLEVALVTGDGLIRALAREVGLPVFESVESGQRARRWRRPREDDEALERRPRREAWEAAAKLGPAVASARRWRAVRIAFAVLIFLAVLAVLAAGATVIVPSASVTLIPRNQSVIVNLNAVVDPNIRTVDYARSRIPAVYVSTELEGNAQVATSGKKDIPSSRATGRVVFVNQLDAPILIPKGTAMRTSAYVTANRFVTVADVQVPGGLGAQAEAAIEAVEVGPAGNIPENLINEVEGVAALAVRVSNPRPTAGGGSRQVPSVTQADKDRLRAALLKQLQQQALDQLQARLGEQEYILSESLAVNEILDETFDRFVAEEAPSLGLQLRVRIAALKVGMQDANALVFAAMATKVPPGYELIPNGLLFQRQETLVPADRRGNLTLVMRGTGFAAARIDLDAVRRAIAGRPVASARSYLSESLPLQADPRLDVWPAALGRMPFLAFRISMDVRPEG